MIIKKSIKITRTLEEFGEEVVDGGAGLRGVLVDERAEQDLGAGLPSVGPCASAAERATATRPLCEGNCDLGGEAECAPEFLVEVVLGLVFPLAEVLRRGNQIEEDQRLAQILDQVLCSDAIRKQVSV